jgi:hypothetical protein
MRRIEREFNTKIYKNNKYYIELFLKLFSRVYNKEIEKIKSKIKRELREEYANFNIDDDLIDLIKTSQINLKKFYDKFVENFIRAVFNKSKEETAEFLKIFELEPKTNVFDIKSLNTLIKNARDELDRTIKVFDVFIETFKQVKAVQNQNEIDKILIKNLLDGRNVKKAERNVFEYLRDNYIDDNNKVKVGNRFYDAKYYAEIVARSRLREASSLGILEEMKKYDIDLVIFSVHNTTCPICSKYEGKIFTLSRSKNLKYDMLDKRPPLHPNCLHTIIPFIET